MRKIAVFTGTRAEYGLLYWILKGLQGAENIELQLYVGGTHLSPEFGYTINHIIADGFQVTEKLEMLLSSDTAVGISKSVGLAIISAAECLERNKPDIVVLLGDRFESMAIAQAAMMACIPIAHIHGGETTEGMIDEAVRHSITKMSHLHFTSTEAYRKRVIQLGENALNVFNVGAPGIDSIVKLPLLSLDKLSSEINFDLTDKYFLITYHPVTLEKMGAVGALENLFLALDYFKDYKLLVTYPNADANGRKLIELIDELKRKFPERIYVTHSLGQLRYLSAMKHCKGVIGNSSSGLIEAPTFQVATVNIGNRQKGRIAGSTVIHSDESIESIRRAVDMAISDEFANSHLKNSRNPYGDGSASIAIVEKLCKVSLNGLINKKFYDLD